MTVDPELVQAASRAIADGDAASVSGWVSAALAEKVARDRKLAQLQLAVAAYEAEFGEITPEEMASQGRADREDAVVVRGRKGARRGAAEATG